MKMLRLALVVTLISPWLSGQKPAAARAAWKPENEVQRTAEMMRLSLQRDFEEVVLIHYSKNSPVEQQKLVSDQVGHAKESTKIAEAFAAALSQAMESKRCDNSCASQIKPLLDDFAEMGNTVVKLNQEQIKPETLAQERAKFEDPVKSSSRYIRAIHLKPKAAPAS